MAIKRIYVDPVSTPLVYYKILRVTLVIGVLINLSQLISLAQTNYTTYGIYFSLVNFGLTIGCAVGMNMRKWGGVLCFHARTLLPVLDSFVAIGIMVSCRLDDASLLGESIGQILGAAIIYIPSHIYFAKRRLLFTPWPSDQTPTSRNTASPLYTPQIEPVVLDPNQWQCSCGKIHYGHEEACICGKSRIDILPDKETAKIISEERTSTTEADEPTPDIISFCRKCGNKLLNGAVFCYQCGTQITKE